MASNESQERVNQGQETESNLQRRTNRQQRVQRILRILGNQKNLRILGLPASGIGGAYTINFLQQGQFKNALISGILTFTATITAIFAKFISELYNSVLDKIEEKLEDKTEPLANWIVNSLENLLLKLWWTLTSDFKGKYYKQLEYTCRDYLNQGLDKDKILKLEKVFVPPQNRYERCDNRLF